MAPTFFPPVRYRPLRGNLGFRWSSGCPNPEARRSVYTPEETARMVLAHGRFTKVTKAMFAARFPSLLAVNSLPKVPLCRFRLNFGLRPMTPPKEGGERSPWVGGGFPRLLGSDRTPGKVLDRTNNPIMYVRFFSRIPILQSLSQSLIF